MKTFTILGTGWLGLPLALELKKQFNLKVSIRDIKKKEDFKNKGLDPYFLNEENVSNLDKLLDTNYLFIDFPPTKFNDYQKFLKKIYNHKNISKIEKIIFISSTSIYPHMEGNFKEDINITNPKSKKIFDIEKLIGNKTDLIFRCAGLMGKNRIAGKYFSNKILDSEDQKVNYVHLEDVIEATKFALENDLSGIFNLCSKLHPTKKEVYGKNALKYGFKSPIFKNKKVYLNRIIDGGKIEEKGFKYKYQNPLEY